MVECSPYVGLCVVSSYLPGGQAKAQVHVDAAASLLVRLRDDQVVEDRLLAQIPTWDQKEPAPKTDKGKVLATILFVLVIK